VALRRLSTSSIQTNGKSSKLWDQTTFQSGMFALATVSLTSTASSIVFSGIPVNYTHLQLRITARMNRADSADGLTVRLNSDTNSNYASHTVRGDGSSSGVEASSSSSYIYMTPDMAADSASANIYGVAIIDILDYTSTTKTKTFRCLAGNDRNGSGAVGLNSGLWLKSPIETVTNITLGGRYGSGFISGSHFALYGIKSA